MAARCDAFLWRLRVSPAPAGRTAGFSLVELLVASTIALVAMAAIAALFGTFGRTVSQSQTLIDLNARIRNAAWQLRQDLYGGTAPLKAWLRPEANAGYFEIVEGTSVAPLGDWDDRIMLTTLSLGTPFIGRLQGTPGIESPVAEVAWFCEPTTQTFNGQPLYNLHRRQLLVLATPGVGSFATGVVATIDRSLSDVSCRNVGTAQVPNSLGDLTKAANRFWTVAGTAKSLQGDRRGEDVILSNVIAFDVRVFDPATNTYLDGSYNTNYQDNTPPTAGPSLRGIEVRIRCVEPSSKQIRQVTVVHSFEGK